MKHEYIRLERVFPVRWCMQMHALYRRSFPRYERKPFRIILSMWHKQKTDIWIILDEGKLIGFATTINGDELVLLDYLAVTEKKQGQRCGSQMLKALQQHYLGKGLFVEIESVYEETSERPLRMKRKHFYEMNGMTPLRVLASVFDVPMELMGLNCEMNFDRYRTFYRDNYSLFAAEHIHELPYPSE